MARVIYAPAALHDLERLVDFVVQDDPPRAPATIDLIVGAISVLTDHPLVGRSTREQLRELIISRGKTGYIALYDYQTDTDTILILAIRHQREAGFSDPAEPE